MSGDEQASWNPAFRPNSEEVEHDDSGQQSEPNMDDSAHLVTKSLNQLESRVPETQRSPSRHFAQSASIHQVPEPEEAEEAFDNLPRQGIDYTNSFPVVSQDASQTVPNQQPEPLPRSQADEIVAENEAVAPSQGAQELASAEASGTTDNIEWDNDAGDDFLTEVNGGHDATAIMEETRFEEGVPLVQQEQSGNTKVSADVDWGDAAAEDDFFGDSADAEEDPFNARPIERKTTEQVLESMNFPPHAANHDVEGSSESGRQPGFTQVLTTDDTRATKGPDLAAAWSEAFDDDELLTEDTAVDPSAFFEDDGEGFLEDTAPIKQTLSNTAATGYNQDANSKGFGAVGGPQRYAPGGTSNYGSNGIRQSYGSTATNNLNYGQSPPVEISKAQSFVDKAKGGYESPYDLPMDLRPKPAPRQTPRQTQSSPQVPPPRGSSYNSPIPPQSPFGTGQAPPSAQPSSTQGKPAAFFEELPITSKPARPPSATRFTPATQSAGPPQTSGPPQQAQIPPPRPEAPNNPPNPTFNHGLVMPNRTLSFGEEPLQKQPPQTASKANNRYSPAPTAQVSQSSVPPAQGRYSSVTSAAPPMAPPRTTSAGYVGPFQPRTSSPLARSTSMSDETALPEGISRGVGSSLSEDRALASTPPQLSPPSQRGQVQSPEKLQRRASDQVSQPPAYQQTGTVVRHRRAPSLIKEFVPPGDDRAQDPLERWKGGPIFKFGAAGIVTSFPVETPRFSVGQTQPLYMVHPGEVKLRSPKTIAVLDQSNLTFPGPLKAKGKKKELLMWLAKHVQTLKDQSLEPQEGVDPAHSHKRLKDRTTLILVLTTLVEYDGNFETNPAAVSSLKEILAPAPKTDPQSGAASYGSEVAPGIMRSNVPPPSHATDVEAIEQIRKHLLASEREKAAWLAVDKNLWGHAMLISSTIQGETWKQVVHEFVRNEVKAAGNNTEALSALYDVFSGNWEECVDQLVPAAARSGFQMVNRTGSTSIQDALAGLDKWQETLALIIGNRTSGDIKAIVSLGELLANYGRAEAAHVCYIVAKIPGLLSGADDPTAHAVLLGANHRQQPFELHKDFDSIIATEVYEFAVNVLAGGAATQPMQYLTPYKLQRALILAEGGRREEAQSYCEVIAASIKANKLSPYLHPQLVGVLDDLVNRLSQAPKEGSKSWLANPKMGDVSNSLLNRFNKFVSGDDNDAPSTTSAQGAESGPFGAIAGEPISISRTGSPAVNTGLGTQATSTAQNGYVPAVAAPGASSRYAPAAPSYSSSPASSYTPSQHRESSGSLPRMSPDHFRRMPPSSYQSAGSYTPTSGLANAPKSYSSDTAKAVPTMVSPALASDAISDSSRPGTSEGLPTAPNQGRRTSYEPLNVPRPAFRDRNSSAYQPRSNGYESRSSSYAPRSGSYAPRSYAPSPATSDRQADDLSRQSSGSYVPQAPLLEAREQEQEHEQNNDSELSVAPQTVNEQVKNGSTTDNDVQPGTEAPISFGGYDPTPSYGYQPTEPATGGEESSVQTSIPSYGQNYEPPADAEVGGISSSYAPPSFGGYQPPSGDQPYEPGSPEATGEKQKKKKGIMDLSDDEDDMTVRAAALKKDEKARKDREADEAFRLAAEQDAKRDASNKAGNRSSWFGGWLGGKKKDLTAGPEPVIHKAKLGEESSFVYDENLKQWINKKAGAEAVTEKKATPPPPKGGPPSRSSSVGPPMAGPPKSLPSAASGLGLGATPPSRGQSPLVNMTTATEANLAGAAGPTSGGPSTNVTSAGAPPAPSGLAPPSRPGTGMSGVSNASSIDDLLGGPPSGARKGSGGKKGKKGGRYIDVMSK